MMDTGSALHQCTLQKTTKIMYSFTLTMMMARGCSHQSFVLSVKTHGHCGKCRFVFTSTSDGDRHKLLVHDGKQQQERDPSGKHMCKVCMVAFDTRYKLLKHQDTTGHKKVKTMILLATMNNVLQILFPHNIEINYIEI